MGSAEVASWTRQAVAAAFRAEARAEDAPREQFDPAKHADPMRPRVQETCGDCRGSGVFYTYSGRSLGACRRCKGAGVLEFARNAEQRAKARIQREQRANRKVEENWQAFAAEYPEPAAWILAKEGTFGFALSMHRAVQKYGYLTSGQASAVQRCMAQDEQRDRERAEREAARSASAAAGPAASQVQADPGLRLPKLFDIMQRHARFYAGELRISRQNGASLCWLRWGDLTVGKIEDARVRWFRAGSASVRERATAILVEFEADPLAAAVKYGKESGRCCSCGRDLTDPASIDAGIGPICASKFEG